MTSAKNALLVGATSGIGRETARLLAKDGYRVIVVGRNQAAGNELARELHGTFIQANMSLLSEVSRVADQVKAQVEALDVIVHSADVLRVKRENTAEGHELSFATNYLSRFLLNSLLIDLLQKSLKPRIIHVAAANMPLALTSQNFPLPLTANGFTGHNIGQAANDYYGLEFAERFKSLGIRINILNPGIVDTDIRRRGDGGPFLKSVVWVMEQLMRPVTAKPADYAELVAAIATDRHAPANNSVLIDRKGKPITPRKDRLDVAARQYVWQQSEVLTRVQPIRLSNL